MSLKTNLIGIIASTILSTAMCSGAVHLDNQARDLHKDLYSHNPFYAEYTQLFYTEDNLMRAREALVQYRTSGRGSGMHSADPRMAKYYLFYIDPSALDTDLNQRIQRLHDSLPSYTNKLGDPFALQRDNISVILKEVRSKSKYVKSELEKDLVILSKMKQIEQFAFWGGVLLPLSLLPVIITLFCVGYKSTTQETKENN